MSNFDPPDSHWAANFDERLLASFHYLKDELDLAKARVAELEKKDTERDASLAQAVADMKFYARER